MATQPYRKWVWVSKNSIIAAALGSSLAAHAAVSYGTAGGLYTQGFDTLPTSGDANTWANDSTLDGWYLFSSQSTTGASGRVTTRPDNVAPADWVPVTSYRADDATPVRSNFYSLGSDGSSERALGGYTTANGNPFADQLYGGDNMYAVAIQNTTGSQLTDLTVGYTGEQWQGHFNADVSDSLVFSYLIKSGFDAQADVPTQNTYAPYTLVAALDFVGRAQFAPDAPLDGNNPANRETLSQTLAGVTLNPNDYLILRWLDNDVSGDDLGLAIDNVTFSGTAVPEPASAVALGAGLLLATRRRRR